MISYQAVAVDGILKTPWRDLVALWIGVAVKVASIGLSLFGAFSGLQQFEGKAFVWRLATYPVAALVVRRCADASRAIPTPPTCS